MIEQKWIPCENEMPKERDSLYKKYKDTESWSESMFEKISDVVIVTAIDEEGNSVTHYAYTTDGEWNCELFGINESYRIIAWMPLPEPYRRD